MRSFHIRAVILICLSAAVTLTCFAGSKARSAPIHSAQLGPIAIYHFDEGSGTIVHDSSGNRNDGSIVGTAKWGRGISGDGIFLNGSDSVRIPSTPLLAGNTPKSVSVWIHGSSSPLHFVKGTVNVRSPYFEVAGDRIFLAANSDVYQNERNATLSRAAKNTWAIWTGSADTNLTNWQYVQRTEEPFSGIEPKLQVVGDRIYYEYFGQGRTTAWQVFTATSRVDGSDWRDEQQTHERTGYRVEQALNIQVVGDRVYMAFPKKYGGPRDEWQLTTASYNRDGSHFTAVRQTPGMWTNLQVVGSTIYYLFTALGNSNGSFSTLPNALYFASSDLDGAHWHIVRKIAEGNDAGGSAGGAFQVVGKRVYLSYAQRQRDGSGWTHLFTAVMRTDGTDLHARQRTFGPGFAYIGNIGLQVVGTKVYYLYFMHETQQTASEFVSELENPKRSYVGYNLWTAEANVDGSGWKAVRRTVSPPDVMSGYRSLEIVGGKEYFGATQTTQESAAAHSQRKDYALLGFAGANVVAKGDAYGIGLTENGNIRGFLNAGQDYRFRAEAPSDTAGAIVDAPVDTGWHNVVMTYDKRQLRLFVDGRLAGSTHYHARIGKNPFPLVIGDGFRGVIDEVSIYNRILSPMEIQKNAAVH